ncbi:type II toxin-antitoxin system HicB family antitoxin [Roseococcus sp.]|uniref:type II toxin-antitoxin system HicB family antitoxin n=1 Tax=Roseococcus sp. TaxID=2109646 RepID=UPI003BA8B675
MTETLSYPAELVDTVDGVTISFPDFPGVQAWGADEAEALRNGAEALQTALWHAINDGMIPPEPSEAHERPMISVMI